MKMSKCFAPIAHVNNVPTMQFFTGISRNTETKSYMLSFTECVWEFRSNALWDTLFPALPFSPLYPALNSLEDNATTLTMQR